MTDYGRPKRIVVNAFTYGVHPRAGISPAGRDLAERLDFGFFLLDKESGPTSFEATRRAARIVGATKAGHSGTLDPKVTGLLVVGVGRATRLLGFLLAGGKEYLAAMHINEIIPHDILAAAFEHFTGAIEQLPPVRSRVKRRLREREIYGFKRIERDGKTVRFTVSCEGGTYIRKLCHDIGGHLGVNAHMTGLRRLRVGPFRVEDAKTEDELAELAKDKTALTKAIRPAEELIPHLPRIYAADHAVRLAAGGIPVKIKGVESYEETVEAGKEAAVVTLKGELIGIGVACEPPGKIKGDPEAVIVRLKTCFLDVASYPHFSEYLPPDDTDTCMLSGD